MLILALTTDKLQLVTSSTSAIAVHATFANNNSGTITPGKQNTAISSAATTDVVAAPAAGYTTVQLLVAMNNGGAANTLSVLYNANGTTYILFSTTVNPGEALQYVEGVGFFKYPSTLTPLVNASTSDQSPGTTETYITGSNIAIPSNRPIQVGTTVEWEIIASKTAASTAAGVFTIKFGTAGTTGDASVLALTMGAQTAATDQGYFLIVANFRGPVGASCILRGSLAVQHLTGTTTGFVNLASPVYTGTSSGFNCTTAGSIVGLSCTPGSAAAWTIQSVRAIMTGN